MCDARSSIPVLFDNLDSWDEVEGRREFQEAVGIPDFWTQRERERVG